MSFHIKFVEDHQLPEDVAWVQARADGERMFFVKRSAVSPEVLAAAWAAGTRFTLRASA